MPSICPFIQQYIFDELVIPPDIRKITIVQYCDSNIGLFSFASYKVIALPTIATAIVVALTRS